MIDSPSIPPAPLAAKIGLGCVTFGREIDAAASFEILDHAWTRGVTCFDTAAAYGNGTSETILGAWLAAHRAERNGLTLATKLLPPYSAARIESGVEESLTRLRTDWIDVLFLHQWHDSALQTGVLAVLASLVRARRVRALGVSNFSAVQLADFLARQAQLNHDLIRAVQNVHNFALRGFDDPLGRLCAREEIALVGYSPLGAGFLTGKHDAGAASDSRFAIVPGHQALYFNETARSRLARLEDAAARAGLPLVQLALAWALRDPRVGTVLVGGRHCAHLDQAFAARSFTDHPVFAELARD